MIVMCEKFRIIRAAKQRMYTDTSKSLVQADGKYLYKAFYAVFYIIIDHHRNHSGDFIANDKMFVILLVCCAEFAPRKRHT